jgi:hypothetical protein
MRYLDTAFGQLHFAIKLMQAAEDGQLDLEAIDRPLTIQDAQGLVVLPDKVLDNEDELVHACQNLVTIAYGAAAITLDRCREEAGVSLPGQIETEMDQWVSLVYQIRNAFAHDIAEPRWHITKERYRRTYRIGRVEADLSEVSGKHFEYSHVGGAEGLFLLKKFGDDHAFGSAWPGQ